MGMMNMAPMPQVEQPDPMYDRMPQVELPDNSAPMPQMGMMGGQPVAPKGDNPSLSHGNFNQVVMVDDKPVQVQAGVAQVDGKKFMVSDDGVIVTDDKGNLVGHVEGQQFVPADQEYLKLMQAKGYVQ